MILSSTATTDATFAGSLRRVFRTDAFGIFAGDWLSVSRLKRNIALVLFLVLVNKLGTMGNIICYAVLLFMAMRSTEGALKALLVSSVVVMSSGGPFVEAGTVGKALKFVLLYASAASIVVRVAQRRPAVLTSSHMIWLLAFGAVAATLALVNDYFVEIVLLKLGTFTVGLYALLAAAQSGDVRPVRLARWLLAVSLVVVGLSFISLLLGAGYATSVNAATGRIQQGFSGMFSHPQSSGVVSAMLAMIWIVFLAFVKDDAVKRILYALLLGLIGLIFLSGARTGLVGLTIALVLTYALVVFGKRGRELKQIQRFAARMMSAAVILLPTVVVFELMGISHIGDYVENFLRKDDFQDVLAQPGFVEIFQRTRGSLMEYNWNQFMENFWTGVGFGVDTTIEWQRTATLLSASVERGFWPYAILAEVGVIGTVVFAGFLWSLIGFLGRRRAYLGIAALISVLVLNLSETSMFAFGGLGALSWVLVAIAMSLSQGGVTGDRSKQGVSARSGPEIDVMGGDAGGGGRVADPSNS